MSANSRHQFTLRRSRRVIPRLILVSTGRRQSPSYTRSSETPGVYIHPALAAPSLSYDMPSRTSHNLSPEPTPLPSHLRKDDGGVN